MPTLKPNHIFVTDEEDTAITKAAIADRDATPFTDAQWAKVKPQVQMGRPKAQVTKERITIRLSADVISKFRATGVGWQTRIDAALKEYLTSH